MQQPQADALTYTCTTCTPHRSLASVLPPSLPSPLPPVQFFNIVALPMYQSMALAFPSCSPMLSALKANLSYWSEREAHYSSVNSIQLYEEGGH